MPRAGKRDDGIRNRRLAGATVGALALAATIWPASTRTPASQSSTALVPGIVAPALAVDAGIGAMAVPDSLPASLDGSLPPRLPIDARGHLGHKRAVREFFDYFLTSQGEVSPVALDALVRHQIARQLDGTAAAAEAWEVWQHYAAYRAAIEAPAHLAGAPDSQLDLDSLHLALEQRDAIGTRTMGEWSEPFFGAELQSRRTDLERLRIMSNALLSDAQKTTGLAALDATLSSEERAARERVEQRQASIDTIALLQKRSVSPEEMRAQITQALGPNVAERVVQMHMEENAWRAKYSDYVVQRTQIDRLGLSPGDHDARLLRLRQEFFGNGSAAMRAASLDRSRP
jgi:lipase chaperone LimK